MRQLVKRFSIWSGIFLVACSAPPLSSQNAAPPPSLTATDLCKVADGTATPQDVSTIAALRSNVERGPLYTIPAAAGVVACSVNVESGVITLEYRFKEGGRLHVKRDSRIEYTEQVARFHLALEENPETILASAERAVFGVSGCGIDWQKADMKAAADDPGATETLYYGDVCNCRAGIRRDAAGRVVELMLRSAC